MANQQNQRGAFVGLKVHRNQPAASRATFSIMQKTAMALWQDEEEDTEKNTMVKEQNIPYVQSIYFLHPPMNA